MPNYIRKPYKFITRGIGLRHPPDLLPQGLYPVLNNMSPHILGGLQPRSGIGSVQAGYPSSIHSIRRLNDPTNSTFARLLGSGTELFDTTTTAPIDTGYSGLPLSMVPMRPSASPQPWMYVSDGTRSRKVRTDRTNYGHGIAPAFTPVSVTRGQPNYAVINDFSSTSGWANSGTAGAITQSARFNTTIASILYDVGTTGWCSVVPSVMDFNYQPGAFVIFNSAPETPECKIRQVFNAIVSTTIASIIYDVGTSGLCSVVLTAQSTGIQPDCVILLNSGGGTQELVRVLQIAQGVNATQVSLRLATVHTHAAGETVTGQNSFRVYTQSANTAGQSIGGGEFTSSVTSGLGYLALNTSGSPLNLATINNRPVTQQDYHHISIAVDKPANITTIRIYLLLDPTFPSDFTQIQNALYKDITVSPYQASVNSSLSDLSAQQSAIQQQIINANSPVSSPASSVDQGTSTQGQLLGVPVISTGGISVNPQAAPIADPATLGYAGWTELNFHISEMTRIGSGQADTISSVTGLLILINCTATVSVQVSSWWLGGTYGADSGGQLPYTFYSRFRAAKTTGAKSNPSPLMYSGIDLQRELGIIQATASGDPQVDTIDLFVQGASLSQPVEALSVPNTTANVNYDIADASIVGSEVLSFTNFQPFPIIDLPHTGTCNVSGTTVQYVSGAPFNTSWQAGSDIIINGVPFTLAGPPLTTSILFLQQDAGAQTSVSFLLPEATIGGQPLQSMWGPDPITGVMFAVGDGTGNLYWTNPNDPDSASDSNSHEVTSPSEPLLNGFMYDGRCYVYTSERLMSCYPQQGTDPITGAPTLDYIPQDVPNSKGIMSTFGLCVGDTFYGVARNGIFASSTSSITDEDLYPLFPHANNVGQQVYNYYPVDFNQPNFIRLVYTRSGIYFLFQDTNGARQCFRYNTTIPTPGWWPQYYEPVASVIYEEEGQDLSSILLGGMDGAVYQLNNTDSDNGSPITFSFITPSFDLGDERLQKLFLDYMLDVDQQGQPFTLTPRVNKLQTLLPATSTTGTTGRDQIQIDIIQPLLALYQDIALEMDGSSATARPIFYSFEPNAVLQPYLAVNMSSPNYVSHGFTTYGHLRDSYFVWISTAPIIVTILTELGLTYIFTLPSSGGKISKQYFPLAPLKGLLFYYSAVSATPFALFTDETIINVKQWGDTGKFMAFKPFAGQSQ